MREHRDNDTDIIHEPAGIEVGSQRLYDTTIEQIILCRYTGLQPDPRLASSGMHFSETLTCINRALGIHPNVQCLSLYNMAKPTDTDPTTITDLVGPVVRRSAAGDEPTFVEPFDDSDV